MSELLHTNDVAPTECKTPAVVICGTSLFMMVLEATMQDLAELQIVRLDPNCSHTPQRIAQLHPRAVIVENRCQGTCRWQPSDHREVSCSCQPHSLFCLADAARPLVIQEQLDVSRQAASARSSLASMRESEQPHVEQTTAGPIVISFEQANNYETVWLNQQQLPVTTIQDLLQIIIGA